MSKNDNELSKMAGKLYDEDGKSVFRPKKNLKVKFEEGVKMGRYSVNNLDQDLLLSRFLISRSFVDFVVWEMLKSNLSLLTGLSHTKQSDIVKATGLSKGKVSESMKRLRNSIELDDGYELPELIREYSDCDCPAGFALHPELVIIGEHERARLLWLKAEQQCKAAAIRKASKIAEETITKAKNEVLPSIS